MIRILRGYAAAFFQPSTDSPDSALVDPIGGILEEIIFWLLITTVLDWLISTVILNG